MRTFEELTKDANLIFNNLYKYEKLYKKEKLYTFEIKCKIHGLFEKSIYNHINKKQGCPLCSKPSKLTKNMLIKKAILIHGDIYDYSQLDYINVNTKIKIQCKDHGLFEQLPTNHLKGQKCPKCSNRHKITNELFIEKAIKIHGNKYDYSEINYINNNTDIKIFCKEHGYFYQMPLNHLTGNQCYRCSNIVRTNDDFIHKANIIHKKIYEYTKTNYITSREKIIITCKIHGDFIQCPNDHLSGNGCQKCSLGNYSKVSIEWMNNIMKKENIFIQHAENMNEKEVIINHKKYRFDGYCEKTNTVYEFMGDLWHGNPKIYKMTDFNPLNKKLFGELYEETMKREKLIRDNGFNLITIWESDYKK